MHDKLAHMTLTSLATLALVATLAAATVAQAQVAGGTTTVETRVTASTQVAMGWSAKKTLLGKSVYNDAGAKVGKVQDLIISPDRNVSYVIVGAGGFIGLGRHDVAIPVSQIQDKAGKLVLADATQDSIRKLPAFTYMTDTKDRDRFVAAASQDIAKGKAAVAELERKANAAHTEAKAGLYRQISTLQVDINAAEARLSELRQASAVRWQEFEAGVSAAIARLRKSLDSAEG